MAGIVNGVKVGISYLQHGLCYAVGKCGSAMQVGGVLMLGIEVSNYAKEHTWWTQSGTVAELSTQRGKFSTWCGMDPKLLSVVLIATGSVLTFFGDYGRINVNKVRELNAAIAEQTRLTDLNTAATKNNTAARKAANETFSASRALVNQELEVTLKSRGKKSLQGYDSD